jgi:hypothetical protein
VGAATGDAGFLYLRSANEAGLSRAGEDLELVLELAALAEGIVIGVEGRAAQLDGPA